MPGPSLTFIERLSFWLPCIIPTVGLHKCNTTCSFGEIIVYCKQTDGPHVFDAAGYVSVIAMICTRLCHLLALVLPASSSVCISEHSIREHSIFSGC